MFLGKVVQILHIKSIQNSETFLRIRETKNFLTDADSRIDTTLERLSDLKKMFFRGCVIFLKKTQKKRGGGEDIYMNIFFGGGVDY